MSNIFDQNKICRFHGVPHPQGTTCTGIDFDPSQKSADGPEYDAVYNSDADGRDAAGRAIDKRGKLVERRGSEKKQSIKLATEVIVLKPMEIIEEAKAPELIAETKPEIKIVNSVVQPKVVETIKEVKPVTSIDDLEDIVASVPEVKKD